LRDFSKVIYGFGSPVFVITGAATKEILPIYKYN